MEYLYFKPAEQRAKELKDGPAPDRNPSGLEAFLANGVPPWDDFLAAMTVEFPGETAEHWAGVWSEAKRIEGEKRAAADSGHAAHRA